MTEHDLLKEIKKYKKLDKLSTVLLIVLLLAAIFCVPKIWLKIFTCLLVLIAVLFFTLKTENQKSKILTDRMDPQAYHTVYHSSKYAKVNGDEDIQIAYFIGDYNKVISLVEDKKKKAVEKGKKLNNVPNCLYLCLSYFELGDYENASESIDYFKSLFEGRKSNEFFELSYIAQLDFIRNFIDGRYDKCIAIEDVKTKLPDKAMRNTFRARMDYYTALAYYYNGDMDTAKRYFETVVDFCPRLNYARFAGRYLNMIHN